jgi:hypothetical protein
MIVVEHISDKNLDKRYSDNGVLIRQIETDTLYSEAIDIVPCPFTYEETDIPIEDDDEDADASDYEEALSELGVRV